MRTSPLHGEFEQLLLACSEGCAWSTVLLSSVHAHWTNWHSIVRSMLLVVFSHNNYYYPMIVTSNILVVEENHDVGQLYMDCHCDHQIPLSILNR